MKVGWIALPAQLHQLDVLANGWIIGIAGLGAVAEFFADKIPWVDTAWDGVHTLIRPLGGALLSMAIVDGSNPEWQVGSLLLGGSAALLAHAGKSGVRTLVNVSPEPYSNAFVSTGEDAVTGGLLVLAITYPIAAAAIAITLVLLSIWLVVTARRAVKRWMVFRSPTSPS
jgi:hypothetical protein